MELAGDRLSPKKLKLGTVAAECGKVAGAVRGPQFHPQLSSAARSSGEGPGSLTIVL